MDYITLSQLQNKIKQAIERNVSAQWVLCDISDIKVNGTGHCYLELVEKNEGRGAIPRAKATAIIWKNNFSLINGFFFQNTGSYLTAGMKVMLLVESTYHELYGLSLIVRDIDPTYSIGDMERQKRETILQLTNDGVLDMNKELPLPVVVERIAIVSSATAAGYGDFINHITNNDYGYTFKPKLFEAVVQGEGAENSIVSALINISNDADNYDAVVLIRGGGSQSDLSCFNSYTLCSYIAQFPIPIITGIGHDKDKSVADIVAHTSLKTPTAVANFLVDTKRELEDYLDNSLLAIRNYLKVELKEKREQIDSLSMNLKIQTIERTSKEKIKLERGLSTIEMGSKTLIREKLKWFDTTRLTLLSGSNSIIREQLHRLSLMESKIDSSDPKHILKIGYSIATVNGKAVKSVKQIKKGDNIKVMVKDGVIDTTAN